MEFHNNVVRFYGITKRDQGTKLNISYKKKILSSKKLMFFTIRLEKNYFFVMEYADGDTLRYYLKNNFDNFTWNDKYDLAYQLTRTVSCLHKKEIVHSDLVFTIIN